MNSDSKKMPASISYVVALACFFLPFIQISCKEMNMEFDISAYAMATGTAGDSIAEEMKKGSGMGEMGGMMGGQQQQTEKAIELLLAMVALGLGLFIGLQASSGAIYFASILGVIAAFLTIMSIPSAKPGMEGVIGISMQIGFYGILAGSFAGCAMHWMRLKQPTAEADQQTSDESA